MYKQSSIYKTHLKWRVSSVQHKVIKLQSQLNYKNLLVKYIFNLQRYHNKLTGLNKDLFTTRLIVHRTVSFLKIVPEGGANNKSLVYQNIFY